jgi:hypothetical protein
MRDEHLFEELGSETCERRAGQSTKGREEVGKRRTGEVSNSTRRTSADSALELIFNHQLHRVLSGLVDDVLLARSIARSTVVVEQLGGLSHRGGDDRRLGVAGLLLLLVVVVAADEGLDGCEVGWVSCCCRVKEKAATTEIGGNWDLKRTLKSSRRSKLLLPEVRRVLVAVSLSVRLLSLLLVDVIVVIGVIVEEADCRSKWSVRHERDDRVGAKKKVKEKGRTGSREKRRILVRLLRSLVHDVIVTEGAQEPSDTARRRGRALKLGLLLLVAVVAVVVIRVEGGAALNAEISSARAVVTLRVGLGVRGVVVAGLIVGEGRVLAGVGVTAGLWVRGSRVGVLLIRLLLVLVVLVALVVVVVALGRFVGGVGL